MFCSEEDIGIIFHCQAYNCKHHKVTNKSLYNFSLFAFRNMSCSSRNKVEKSQNKPTHTITPANYQPEETENRGCP